MRKSARVLAIDTVGRAAPDVLNELGDVRVRHVDVPTLVKLAEVEPPDDGRPYVDPDPPTYDKPL